MPWYGAWRRGARNARARPVLAAGSPRSSGPHAYRIRDGAQISVRKQYVDNRRVGDREPAIRLIVDKDDGQFLGVACLPYVVLRKVRKILALCNSQGSMRRRSDNAKVGVAGRGAIRGHGIPEVDLSFPPADASSYARLRGARNSARPARFKREDAHDGETSHPVSSHVRSSSPWRGIAAAHCPKTGEPDAASRRGRNQPGTRPSL